MGVLTGTLGAAVIEPLVTSLDRRDVRVIPVENRFFGGNTGVTGLMVGEDLVRVLHAEPEGHRYLLPDVCLSDDGRFLDGIDRRRTATPGRGRAHRRACLSYGDRGRTMSVVETAAVGRHHRAAQRRQVDPVQPHRR